MKKLSIALLAIALLLPAGMAQAYAIYNHVDYEVCVGTLGSAFSFKDCKFTIPAHGKHNGGHGDSLSHVLVMWYPHRFVCMSNGERFSIPKGGYARIYPHEVKVYKHDGKHVDTKSIGRGYCGPSEDRKNSSGDN
ncbi:MAG: hypothetical protein KQH53_14460 [Desulfarculaceae bacterium]|nr:hypothetical protein [Desulfarculaceae bacterium]